MTYEQLQMNGLPISESELRQSSQQGFPANLTALQEKVSAIVTIVTSGARLQECSEKFVRAGSSVRIRPVYSQEAISGTSVECLMILPRWGIRLAGEYGALVTSAPRTKGKEYLCWVGTPTASMKKRSKNFTRKILNPAEIVEQFPTPTASRHEDCLSERKRHTPSLDSYVAMFPTPTVFGNNNKKRASKKSGNGLATVVGGKLNPTWVEWLMGFPLGWTDLDASETP